MGETEIVFGTLGMFLVVSILLGLSGLAGSSIEWPDSYDAQDGTVLQSKTANAIECVGAILTPFLTYQDIGEICQRTVETKVFGFFTDILVFAFSLATFFFQLATFQLELPAWLTAIIVGPPAIIMAYIGLRFARGGG